MLQFTLSLVFLLLSSNFLSPAHKNSCRRWERFEDGGTGSQASTVCFLSPSHQKTNFHHGLICGSLGFPLEFWNSFQSPLPLFIKKWFCYSCTSPNLIWHVKAMVICSCATEHSFCFCFTIIVPKTGELQWA